MQTMRVQGALSRPTASRRTVVVRAGLFGGNKPKAPAKPEKKSSPFSFGSKPKAPAKKAAPAKKVVKKTAPAKKKPSQFGTIQFGTKKVGTKRAAAPKKKASADGSGIEVPFFGQLDATDLVEAGDIRYERNMDKSSKARGAQKIVGYKGSGQAGSAPMVDAQGQKSKYGGKVYIFADKYGGNIDEFSPIFTPETRQQSGDYYEPGLVGIAVWAVGFVSLIAVGLFSIYSTSALA